MDRYDRVIHDIQQKTRDGILRWKPVPPSKLSDLAPYGRRIESAYRADYALADRDFQLLFVDRTLDVISDFIKETGELSLLEVFVPGSEGEVALKLYSGVVERGDLLELSSVIEGFNDGTKGFLDAFEKANAAGSAS